MIVIFYQGVWTSHMYITSKRMKNYFWPGSDAKSDQTKEREDAEGEVKEYHHLFSIFEYIQGNTSDI